MPFLGFRMRVIDPAGMALSPEDDRTSRKGERFGRVQVGPFHVFEGVFRFSHFKRIWMDRDIQRAVIHIFQGQAERFEIRFLLLKGAIGIVPGRGGSDPMPLDDDPFDGGHTHPYLFETDQRAGSEDGVGCAHLFFNNIPLVGQAVIARRIGHGGLRITGHLAHDLPAALPGSGAQFFIGIDRDRMFGMLKQGDV